ncbi:hypothetical protein GCM10027067_06120 [Pseudactinotalea suaedae]
MDPDEAGADDVPVRVLERQLEVVERVEPQLEQLGHVVAILDREARNGERGVGAIAVVCHSLSLPRTPDPG